jgi:hypothetical protein
MLLVPPTPIIPGDPCRSLEVRGALLVADALAADIVG